jgi:hypothetical protein
MAKFFFVFMLLIFSANAEIIVYNQVENEKSNKEISEYGKHKRYNKMAEQYLKKHTVSSKNSIISDRINNDLDETVKVKNNSDITNQLRQKIKQATQKTH